MVQPVRAALKILRTQNRKIESKIETFDWRVVKSHSSCANINAIKLFHDSFTATNSMKDRCGEALQHDPEFGAFFIFRTISKSRSNVMTGMRSIQFTHLFFLIPLTIHQKGVCAWQTIDTILPNLGFAAVEECTGNTCASD